MRKHKIFFSIATALVTGLAGLLIWAEREDRIQTGRHPNGLARYALLRVFYAENQYVLEHDDFARSLSKLKLNNRIDFHTIEFVPSESNSQTVVYRAIPDRFNWMMLDLNMYTIAIVSVSSKDIKTLPLLCASSQRSNITPKIKISISSPSTTPVLKCSSGSRQVAVYDP